jgi:ABC-2 type transport system ATP-binding protein
MNNFAIQTQNLSVSYDTHNALTDLTLDIPTGSVVGLLGRNGAGKSTFLHALLGFIEPTAGSSRLLDENSPDLSASAKSRLGIVLQNPVFYNWLTAKELIEYTAHFYPNWDTSVADRLVVQWEIPLARSVAELSSGELQKLACLLALSHNADLFILDEPASDLDPVSRRQLLSELIEVASGEGKTILFSTHIVSDLERIADRVVIFDKGRLKLSTSLDALKESVKRIRIFPAHPDTAELSIPGLTHIRRETGAILAVATAFDHAMLQSLSARFPNAVQVEDLSLEDIFLELSRD